MVPDSSLTHSKRVVSGHGWLEQHKKHQSAKWKRIAYYFIRPMLKRYMRSKLVRHGYGHIPDYHILPEWGFPLEDRRRWAARGVNIKDAVILVCGTGWGWDVVGWAGLEPAKIIATDLFECDTWDQVSAYCWDEMGVQVTFRQSPLENHAFVDSGSIDLTVSDAVYEHCCNLDAVMAETWRMLKKSGSVYASYGPLWYTAGGDHFSGCDGLHTVYNHLLLERGEYREYFNSLRKPGKGTLVELDLFSRLATSEYLSLFHRNGFRLDELIIEVSASALLFRERYRKEFDKLQTKYPFLDPLDFIIKTHLIRLKKRES